MQESQSERNAIKVRLTKRYSVALLMIAVVLLSSFFILTSKISENEEYAYIINTSGMQRMLSQRIALLAQEVSHASTIAEAEIHAQYMQKAVAKMEDNHKRLSTGEGQDKPHILSLAVQKMYFSPGGVDERVTDYLNKAKDFLNIYHSGGVVTHEHVLLDDITTTAREGLLTQLNDVVFQHEREAKAKVKQFKYLEMVVLLLGLIVLALEAIFIFNPMVKQIVKNITGLEKANAELTEFSYRISHDLRAPIVSSLGVVDVCKQAIEDKDHGVIDTSINHIETAMRRLQNLINDVIDIAKLNSIDVEKEEVDIEQLINKGFEKLAHMPNASKIDTVTEMRIDSNIKVKKVFLRQALENLLSNAFKYSDFSKEKPFVKVTVEKVSNKCVIVVSDNGIGVPEEYQDQLFGMFKRFHPKVSFGSGLGLYFVAQNMDALDGDIKYVPLADGSSFRLSFPI